MRGLTTLTRVEASLLAREPAALFFTLLLPLLLLLLNAGGDDLGVGLPVLEALVPGYLVYVMATAGMMALPEALATQRESGYLRRLRISPLRAWQVLGAHALVQLAVALVGLVLLVGTAVVGFGLALPGNPGLVLAAVLLAATSTLATGFLLASLLPTTRTTQAVAAALYFPMIFLSGAIVPKEALPDVAAAISPWLPMTHAVDLLRAAWTDQVVDWPSAAVLVGVAIASAALSTRTFRWEPR